MTGTYSKLFQQTPKIPPQEQSLEAAKPEQLRTEFRSEKRTADLPVKRKTKRYSFEFYDDQIFKLKQLKREAEDNGENLTLSDMAREALDFYLKSKKPSK